MMHWAATEYRILDYWVTGPHRNSVRFRVIVAGWEYMNLKAR